MASRQAIRLPLPGLPRAGLEDGEIRLHRLLQTHGQDPRPVPGRSILNRPKERLARFPAKERNRKDRQVQTATDETEETIAEEAGSETSGEDRATFRRPGRILSDVTLPKAPSFPSRTKRSDWSDLSAKRLVGNST
jgi:hypothetical protein